MTDLEYELFALVVAETLHNIDPEGLAVPQNDEEMDNVIDLIAMCYMLQLREEVTALVVMESRIAA